jgi:endonuclease III
MTAKKVVIDKGYAAEIDWQDSIAFEHITETDFLRESAWVILSSGMREAVIRKKFPRISSAFFEWKSAQDIVRLNYECQEAALRSFNHVKKIEAVIQIARHTHEEGFDSVRNSIKCEGLDYLTQFPYIGPATKYHLAKNIGLPVAKPDRHLLRVAQRVGYDSPHSMCADIAEFVGDKLSVVDLVVWRYATLHKNYLDLFTIPVPKNRDRLGRRSAGLRAHV